MSRRRRLATLSASLALHGGVLLAVLLLASGETELGALFIDLTESAQGDARGVAGPPAPTQAGRVWARALRAVASPRPAPMPSVSSGAAAPLPAREPESAEGSRAESPAPESPTPPSFAASPARFEASEPDPAPRSTEGTEVSAPGASGPAAPSLAVTGPEASVIESGAFSVPGVRGGTPGSAPDVSHGFALAVPGGAGGQSGPGAEYGAYLGSLRRRVQQALGYPLAARRRGLSGTVHIDLVIRPDGAISGVAVADSSSHAVLDDAAVEAIKRLAPEPFPPDVQARTLRVRLPVVFALE
jgi:protein TonB